MLKKNNCWEFTNCGREKGGENSIDFGICPASVSIQLDGINGGKSAGRACWLVKDTFCDDSIGMKFHTCSKCSFYKFVQKEEGTSFQALPQTFFTSKKPND